MQKKGGDKETVHRSGKEEMEKRITKKNNTGLIFFLKYKVNQKVNQYYNTLIKH